MVLYRAVLTTFKARARRKELLAFRKNKIANYLDNDVRVQKGIWNLESMSLGDILSFVPPYKRQSGKSD